MKPLTEEEAARVPDWNKGEPFVVVEEMFRLPWRGVRSTQLAKLQMSCGMCMREPEVGNTWRWVYVEGASNIFVCSECDGLDISERFKERWRNVISPILRRWGSD